MVILCDLEYSEICSNDYQSGHPDTADIKRSALKDSKWQAAAAAAATAAVASAA